MTEGVPPPAGDGRNCNDCNLYDDSRVFPNRRRWCKIQDTTRQLRCHPPRGGGQTVNLPATMPWVGIVAQKAPAFQHSIKESNKTPTALPNPIPAQGAKRVEQNKSFGLAFSKASRRRPLVKTHPRARSEASGAKIKFFASLSFKKASRRRPPVKKPRQIIPRR